VILTAGTTTDPYSGEQVLDWTTPTSVDVEGVLVEPRPSGEPVQDARNAVVSGYTLYLPTSAMVDPDKRVKVRGVVHNIIGEAADWRLGAWRPGLVLQCERTDG
jgi:hypothetical protein